MNEQELKHYGVLGMKWGVRRYQNKDGSLTVKGQIRYAKESDKKINVNSDGSQTVPKGFVFNRIGKSTLDVNSSGGLYVSYGKQDASRYIKNLGPTPLKKLFKMYSDTVQHITVKGELKVPSNAQLARETASLMLSDKKLLKSFNDSFYALTYGNGNNGISEQDLLKAVKDPNSKDAQKLLYSINSSFGDPNYSKETKTYYEYYRKKGYDAIPDILDRYSGTSNTAMIVINANKVELTSSTHITKEVMKSAKSYVKSIEKLKVSEIIK